MEDIMIIRSSFMRRIISQIINKALKKHIHYGTGDGPKMPDGKRTAGDTCPWRK